MGFSNAATGLIVAMPYAAALPIMIWWARASDTKSERIWHVALPALVAAAGLVVASFANNDLLALAALTVTTITAFCSIGPLFALPPSFPQGSAAAGGIALFNTIGVLSGFVGSALIGLIREQTGGYSTAMTALAMGLVISASLVVALGRAMAARALPSNRG